MATKREDGGPNTVREAGKGGRGLARKGQERDHLHFARGINVRSPCTVHNERAAAQERASAAPPQGRPLDNTPSWWQREHDDGAGTGPAAPCRRRSPPSATTGGPSRPFQCSHFTLRATALLIHRRQPLAFPLHRKQRLSPRVHTTAVGHRAGHSGNAHHLSHRQSTTHERYRRHGGRAAKVEREATRNRGNRRGGGSCSGCGSSGTVADAAMATASAAMAAAAAAATANAATVTTATTAYHGTALPCSCSRPGSRRPTGRLTRP